VDSYYGIGEYLVIIPSPYIPFIDVPLPESLTTFNSNIPVATFRQEKRSQQKRLCEDVSEVERETCLRLYKQA
ncbi:hypothetical protein BGZ76_008106, partial [Entomortierella beljakovae]